MAHPRPSGVTRPYLTTFEMGESNLPEIVRGPCIFRISAWASNNLQVVGEVLNESTRHIPRLLVYRRPTALVLEALNAHSAVQDYYSTH